MKSLTFKNADGKEYTTDKPVVLAAAKIVNQDGKTLVGFTNAAIAASLIQMAFSPANDKPGRATKDYLFEVQVNN